MSSKLTDLLARLEAAEGSSRDLDCLLEIAVRGVEAARTGLDPKHWARWTVSRDFWVEDSHTAYRPEGYTSSLDAALALVERVLPKRVEAIFRDAEGDTYLWVDKVPSFAQRLILALLYTLVKALIATEKPHDA